MRQMGLSAEVIDRISSFMSPGFNLTRALISLLSNMLSLGLFAMIGGILTTAILSRKKQD